MKIWVLFFSFLLLIACSSNSPRVNNQSDSSSSSTPSSAQVLKSTTGGITVASDGKGNNRVKAEKMLLRKAIKEVARTMAGNVYDSPDLKKAIKKWVNEQQEDDYEDMVKRRAYDIDTFQNNEYFLQGTVVLNHDYLDSQIKAFVKTQRRSNKCSGRLSIYIAPDAAIPLSSEDIKLGQAFMYSLQEQFINAGFEIKKAKQHKEAQYQINLVDFKKVKSGLNVNFHFTVEVLDHRSAGAVFATKKSAISVSIASIPDPYLAETKALKRAAKKVGADLTHKIISRTDSNEVIFYAQGYQVNDIEQQLAEEVVGLYEISLDDIISTQSTTDNGFTSWSFEVPVSQKNACFNFKQGLKKIQKRVLNTANPNIESAKAGRKWSVFDSVNPPPILKTGQGRDFCTAKVDVLIRDGKLDRPYGTGFNAVDTLKACLKTNPDNPSAKGLLQDISKKFVENAEKALQQNLIPQARRYSKRAKAIWPKNPDLNQLNSKISQARPPVITSAPSLQTTNANLAKADPEIGKKILQTGQYWAILIANQNYQNGVSSLATPFADIESIKKQLIKNYGFLSNNIAVIKDGTQKQIINELNRTLEYVQKNDSLLIFYAGHGHLDRELGFWVPVDGTSPEAKGKSTAHMSTWVGNSAVRDIVNATHAKHILLISDSCFAGTFKPRSRGLGRQKQTSNVPEQIYKMASLTSRTALTSGDIQPVQDGGGNGHSLFAYHFLRVLKENKTISAKELFAKVYQPIAKTKLQQPQYFVMDKVKDEGGDFIFYKH